LTTDAQVTPFPAGLNGQDWAEGVPDLDIPHNVSAGVLLPTISHALGFRLGVLYSYRSGYPFTPGFRDGVDVNADGSNNDPAYVDEAITGTADLYGAWSCLLGQAGRFAARNSCRSRGIHRLDVRVRTAPLRFFHLQGQILIDGLNLMDSADGLPDRALYLVDAKQSISTDAATGVVSIPLIINPGFGRSLVRLTSGRSLRIGLRLTP
jgi:hypothetical protein